MKILVILIAILSASPAFAHFEIRGNYDLLSRSPDNFNKAMDNLVTNNPDIEGITGYGVDAIFVMLGLGAGLRYETFSKTVEGPVSVSGTPLNAEAEFKGSRTSLLLLYRILSTPIAFVGVISHFGLSQSLDYSETLDNSGARSTTKYKIATESSYGIGIEGGATLSSFIVGGELGYTMLKGKNVKDETGAFIADTGGDPVNFDLSGTYMKLMVGVGF